MLRLEWQKVAGEVCDTYNKAFGKDKVKLKGSAFYSIIFTTNEFYLTNPQPPSNSLGSVWAYHKYSPMNIFKTLETEKRRDFLIQETYTALTKLAAIRKLDDSLFLTSHDQVVQRAYSENNLI